MPVSDAALSRSSTSSVSWKARPAAAPMSPQAAKSCGLPAIWQAPSAHQRNREPVFSPIMRSAFAAVRFLCREFSSNRAPSAMPRMVATSEPGSCGDAFPAQSKAKETTRSPISMAVFTPSRSLRVSSPRLRAAWSMQSSCSSEAVCTSSAAAETFSAASRSRPSASPSSSVKRDLAALPMKLKGLAW
ncbi:MAG: hypothetical protein A3J79_13490 [Elusimicrobia bacterium RIFOXYB2_FULL_62_6]|nr:MAG: hypothetical protein A3J79_13490 [Elusimicrobia bacterium RIFOXYB2_FULL_62_6]